MIERLYATTLLALYQTTIALGIALLPVALVARQAGVTLRIDRLVERTGDAYTHARTQ
jgi:hypothetical protein